MSTQLTQQETINEAISGDHTVAAGGNSMHPNVDQTAAPSPPKKSNMKRNVMIGSGAAAGVTVTGAAGAIAAFVLMKDKRTAAASVDFPFGPLPELFVSKQDAKMAMKPKQVLQTGVDQGATIKAIFEADTNLNLMEEGGQTAVMSRVMKGEIKLENDAILFALPVFTMFGFEETKDVTANFEKRVNDLAKILTAADSSKADEIKKNQAALLDQGKKELAVLRGSNHKLFNAWLKKLVRVSSTKACSNEVSTKLLAAIMTKASVESDKVDAKNLKVEDLEFPDGTIEKKGNVFHVTVKESADSKLPAVVVVMTPEQVACIAPKQGKPFHDFLVGQTFTAAVTALNYKLTDDQTAACSFMADEKLKTAKMTPEAFPHKKKNAKGPYPAMSEYKMAEGQDKLESAIKMMTTAIGVRMDYGKVERANAPAPAAAAAKTSDKKGAKK